MDIKTLALKVMELPSAKVDIYHMNFETLFQLSLDASVVVMKNASSASKAENIALLVHVVNEVLNQMKENSSLVDPEKSMKVIVEEYDNLKVMVDNVMPVVFSHLPHLNSSLLSSVLGCFYACKAVSSGEEVVKRQEVAKGKELEKAAVAVEDKTPSPKHSPVETV